MDTKELRQKVEILREYCQHSKENLAMLNDAYKDNTAPMTSIKQLCRKNNQGNLAKIGLTLIAFPFPIIVDDLLGWPFLIAGLIQKKIKNSALYIDDPNKTFSQLQSELNNIQQEIL